MRIAHISLESTVVYIRQKKQSKSPCQSSARTSGLLPDECTMGILVMCKNSNASKNGRVFQRDLLGGRVRVFSENSRSNRPFLPLSKRSDEKEVLLPNPVDTLAIVTIVPNIGEHRKTKASQYMPKVTKSTERFRSLHQARTPGLLLSLPAPDRNYIGPRSIPLHGSVSAKSGVLPL